MDLARKGWSPPHTVITGRLMREELRWAVTRSLDAEPIHPMAKRVWMEAQDLRRPFWTIHHSTGMLKGGEDVVSIYLVQSLE